MHENPHISPFVEDLVQYCLIPLAHAYCILYDDDDTLEELEYTRNLAYFNGLEVCFLTSTHIKTQYLLVSIHD